VTPADVDYAGQVREYLAYCADARGQVEARGFRVDPGRHPSAEGAVKMIPHGSDRARAEAIRRTFAELTSEAAGAGTGTSQPQADVLREAEAGL
jgi:hypothetical protein